MSQLNDLSLINADATAYLLAALDSDQAAFASAQRIETMLRTPCNGVKLLNAVKNFEVMVAASAAKSLVLEALIYRAMRSSHLRMYRCRPRILCGVTPIIQLPACAKGDKLLGIDSDTLVFTTYYITSDFDFNLKSQVDWICSNAPEYLSAYHWMVFYWALLTYDIFHLFNDRGLLANVGGYGSPRFGVSLEEMQILKRACKRLYTYAYGADHRMREATLALDKYNFCMDCPEVGKFCICDDAGGRSMLGTIGEYANAMIASGRAMSLIPGAHNLFHLVIDLSGQRFKNRNNRSHTGGPLRIAHAPNHGFFKGTKYLLDAVDNLQSRGVPVELVKLSGVPNDRVLDLISSCDVLADQFISGAFGYVAIESMALGVPVMCYLSTEVEFPERENLPIVNCHPEKIEETILELIKEKSVLLVRGEQSKEYVRRNYSVEAFAARLKNLYLETGDLPSNTRVWLRTGKPPSRWRQLLAKAEVIYLMTPHYCSSVRRKSARIYGACWQKGNENAELIAQQLGSEIKRGRNYLVYRIKQYPRLARLLLILRSRSLKELFSWFAGTILNISAKGVLFLAAYIGRNLTRRRFLRGHVRALWGVTPIVTLPLLARCDRLLGIQAESVVLSTYHVTSKFDVNLGKAQDKILKNFPEAYPAFQRITFAWALLRFDIFHYFYDRGFLAPVDFRIGINPIELEILTHAGKKLFCYAYGADVRTRETTLGLGKFNLCASCPEPMKYCICDEASGNANIDRIRSKATAIVSMGDMLAYVPGARNHHYWPIETKDVPFVGVEQRKNRPLRIAHVTNHPHFKGTKYLDDAVSKLRAEGFDIEMLTAQGVPNEAVIRIYSEADIVADQFIAGFHGYAALEAMALGKPVICFLRSPQMMASEAECPIINACPDTLYSVLKDILEGRIDLVDLGRRGRRYIEDHYSLKSIAFKQGEMYGQFFQESPRLVAIMRERTTNLKKTEAELEIRKATA